MSEECAQIQCTSCGWSTANASSQFSMEWLIAILLWDNLSQSNDIETNSLIKMLSQLGLRSPSCDVVCLPKCCFSVIVLPRNSLLNTQPEQLSHSKDIAIIHCIRFLLLLHHSHCDRLHHSSSSIECEFDLKYVFNSFCDLRTCQSRNVNKKLYFPFHFEFIKMFVGHFSRWVEEEERKLKKAK